MQLQALKARPRQRRLPPDLGERQIAAVAPNVLDRKFEPIRQRLGQRGDGELLFVAEDRAHGTEKPRLLGITKRGSKYLRKMLIQGARAALPTLSRGNTRLGQWLRGLLARAHSNTVVVALATKMARIVWALLRYGTTFEPRAIAA